MVGIPRRPRQRVDHRGELALSRILHPHVRLDTTQPFSTSLVGRMGQGIATTQLFKMIAGAIHPGKPVANLYVRSQPKPICFAL